MKMTRRRSLAFLAAGAAAGTAAITGCAPSTGEGDEINGERGIDKEIIPEARNGAGAQPSAAWFQGSLFVAFVGQDGRLNVTQRLPAGGWEFPVMLAEWPEHGTGASLVEFGGELHLVFTDQDKRFVHYRSSNGRDWGSRAHELGLGLPAGVRVHGEPSLIDYGGVIWAFFAVGPADLADSAGWSAHGMLRSHGYFSGEGWFDLGGFRARANNVSTAILGEELVLSWSPPGADPQGYTTRKMERPFGVWRDAIFHPVPNHGSLVGGTDREGRAAVFWFYRSTDRSDNFNVISIKRSFDGVQFSPFRNTGGHTSDRRPFAVRATGAGNTLEWVHVGTDPSSRVNFNWVGFP